jgi:uncharacterized membrane protein
LPENKRVLASICAACGALAPDVLILYSKRWTAEGLVFEPTQYLVATILFVLLAWLVGLVYPYRPYATPWKGFVVGVCTPVVIGAIITSAKPASIAVRGQMLQGTLIDLISLW